MKAYRGKLSETLTPPPAHPAAKRTTLCGLPAMKGFAKNEDTPPMLAFVTTMHGSAHSDETDHAFRLKATARSDPK
jgi:hypothetical protein